MPRQRSAPVLRFRCAAVNTLDGTQRLARFLPKSFVFGSVAAGSLFGSAPWEGVFVPMGVLKIGSEKNSQR